jgi:hypothetical protein
MKLYIEDPAEIEYLLELLNDDKGYIQSTMQDTNDDDALYELDTTLVYNQELTRRLKKLIAVQSVAA